MTARNLLIVMTLAGLWHGAQWTFVCFGVLQGFWLVGHRGFRAACHRRPRMDALLQSAPGTALRVALTFVGFSLTLIVFRSPTLGGAVELVGRLFRSVDGLGPPLELTSFWCLAALMAAGHLVGRVGLWRLLAVRLPAPALGLGYATALLFALLLAPDGSNKVFIYFQF
jgi:alginate O-acetyltransferase complex protein AlgI